MDHVEPPVAEHIPAGENLLAEIPALAPPEKKQEEKKRGAAPWLFGFGRGGGALGGSLDGAAGSLSLGRAAIAVRSFPGGPGILGSGRLAEALAALFGRSSWLGGLFASAYGPSVVLAGLAAWAGLVGAAAWKLAGGSGSPADAEAAFSLGPGRALRTGLTLGKPRDLSLDFLARANRGLLGDGSAKDGAAVGGAPGTRGVSNTAEGVTGRDADGGAAKAAEQAMKNARAGGSGKGGRLSGGKSGGGGQSLGGLAGALGGGAAGGGLKDALGSARLGSQGFAAKDLKDMGFKASSRLASFGEKRKMTAARTLSSGPGSAGTAGSSRNPILGSTVRGAGAGFPRGPGIYSSASGTPDHSESSRAMGQLKFADGMSTQAEATPSAGLARQAGADAFEQVRTPPGGVQSGGGGGFGATPNPLIDPLPGDVEFVPPIVPPIGGPGAPDPTTIPGIGPGVNVTPYQGALNATKNLADSAARFKMFGMALIATGGALMAIALMLQVNPFTSFAGAALYVIAVALIGLGVYLMGLSSSMANQAKSIGSTIGNVFKQQDQGKIVDECVDQAVEGGVRMDNCTPSTTPAEHITTVREDAAAESNAGFAIKDGGGNSGP